MATGTYDISTLLAARFTSAAAFGLDTIRQVLDADLAAHNALTGQMVSELCEMTSERQRIYGTSVDGEMVEVDEYGRSATQISTPGAACGFPLNLYQFAVGWTRKYTEVSTPAEYAIRVQAAEQAHLRSIRREIQRAVYLSTNYTFNDHLVDKIDLSVKRFVNADSAKIPNGPNGEEFTASSHTHYNANATLTAAALLANITDVIEHGHGGMVKTVISTTDEAAVRLLTGFVAYPDPRIVYRVTDTPSTTLDISRLDNRAIGIFGGSEIWVKPWAIANYAFSFDAEAPGKPLAFRQRAATTLQGLRIAADMDDYPLLAQYMEAELGVGVWTRTNGAVLYFASGTYADPTISRY